MAHVCISNMHENFGCCRTTKHVFDPDPSRHVPLAPHETLALLNVRFDHLILQAVKTRIFKRADSLAPLLHLNVNIEF